ncbi:MAG: hypothetical protein JWP97_955 [Labilithrix sp.]|nr:hypothetical protein [Labilithrix sp.]
MATCVVACLSVPDLRTVDDPDGSKIVTTPSLIEDGSVAPDAREASDDASSPSVEDAAPPDENEDAGFPDQPGNPDPPGTMCPPAGSPTGTHCCGSASGPPPCVGQACMHCGDCAAKNCSGGSICCAYAPGKSGKYKGVLCAPSIYAHLCP